MFSKKKFYTFVIIFFLNFLNLNSFENNILIKIDNEIITSVDILNETNYLIALNKDLKNLEKNKIFEIAKNSLIKEKIKVKEILKYTDKLILEEKFLNDFITKIFKNQNFETLESFKDYLNSYKIPIEYVKNRISIEIIWNDLIISKFSNKIQIDRKKIETELLENTSKTLKEYFLSEIIFNVPSSNSLNEKFQLIAKDIKEKGFKNSALIHSVSNSSSNNGGEIGWFSENSLNSEIKNILNNLNTGDYTKPITVPGGFLILKINDIKFVENKSYDINKKLNEIVNLKRSEQLNNFSNIYFNKIKKEYLINEDL